MAEITLKQLSQRILGLSRNIVPNANQLTKDVATAFVTEIIDSSPVDTGLTVSSWKVGLNYRPRGTRLFSPGKLGSTASENREAVKAVVLPTIEKRVTGQTISIVNATPYLIYINKGEYSELIEHAYRRAVSTVKSRKIVP